MRIDARTIGDAHIPDCSDKITLGQAAMAFRNNVGDILRTGGKKIALNSADRNAIDIPGVGAHLHYNYRSGAAAKTPAPDDEDPGNSGNHQAPDGV